MAAEPERQAGPMEALALGAGNDLRSDVLEAAEQNEPMLCEGRSASHHDFLNSRVLVARVLVEPLLRDQRDFVHRDEHVGM